MNKENYYVDKKEFAKKFDELIVKRNCKSVELESELKVGRATISRWRNGHTTPNDSQIHALADYFDVRYDWLIGRDDFSPSLSEMGIQDAIKISSAFPTYMKTLGYQFSRGDYMFEDRYFENETVIVKRGKKEVKITWEQYHNLKREIEAIADYKMSELFK